MSAFTPLPANLGRTEDLCFSPDGRQLAIAAFARKRIVLCDLDVDSDPANPCVVAVRELVADSLKLPHGVDFLDDGTLVVANRAGDCAFYALPRAPEHTLVEQGALRLAEPGSVRVSGYGTADAALLVCDNRANALVRFSLRDGGQPGPPEVLLQRWLDLPDGVALSCDGRWMGLSNHGSHSVLLYRYDQCGPSCDPAGILRGVRYPHGLVYSADGRHLLVADAGAPFLRIYAASAAGDWDGVRHPVASVRVLDEETFRAGHKVPQEGGPKGVDLHPAGRWLALTAALQPLIWLDVQRLLADCPASAEPVHVDVDYELHLLEQAEQRRQRMLAESWSWRVLAPLRAIARWRRQR